MEVEDSIRTDIAQVGETVEYVLLAYRRICIERHVEGFPRFSEHGKIWAMASHSCNMH